MSNCPQLPQWVAYLQALIVPVVAAVGVWIAARQMLIANDKLRLDSFERQYERRVTVYEATRSILEQCFRGKITEADTRVFGLRALDAQFLFDAEMYKYLRELQQHIEACRFAQSMTQATIGSDERAEFEAIAKTHSDWIIKQGDEGTGIGARFAPFLVHTPIKPPWLLRWP
jgi:hypothetical protein